MSNFTGKKVAVLGLGIEGEDVVGFLLKKKANITVFDIRKASEFGRILPEFKKRGVNFQLGPDYLKDGLTDFDTIFRSPAFKLSLPEIVEAKKRGMVISSATKLFFNLCPGKIIGVTGTKGKGTTSTLIYKILMQAGKKVFLAGNIGQPMLALLSELDKKSWVVLELSSFQLQDMEKSPHIAVVLFITSEHLDYHQNAAEYIQAKSNIVRHQGRQDFSVLNAANQKSKSFSKLTAGKIYYFSRLEKVNGSFVKNGQIYLFNEKIGKTTRLQLRGEHNWDNICASIIASRLAGANLGAIKKAVFSFSGLEHRLELVRKLNGVSFYNDSFSTTPETTIAAIKAFAGPIVLIAGGSEKLANFEVLGKEIVQSRVKTIILIGKTASRIKKAIIKAGFKGKIIENENNFRQIIKRAFREAQPAGVVLLSPACASFDMFKNYKDRGEQFKQNVRSL